MYIKSRLYLYKQTYILEMRFFNFFFVYSQEIATDVEADPALQEEAGIIHHVLTQMSRYQEDRQQNMGQKWKLPPNGQPICLFSGNVTATRTIIRMDDDSE